MKALVKSQPDVGIWMQQVPEPEIGINDVLIQVKKNAICGTDIHIYNWDEWAQKTIPVPMVVGHEFVGEIVDVGSNVNDFKAGQLVSGEGHVVCGRCRNCMAGRRQMCAHTSGIGVNRTGAFAEYISLPMANVWVHHPDIDPNIASIFDPFGNATHAALQFEYASQGIQFKDLYFCQFVAFAAIWPREQQCYLRLAHLQVIQVIQFYYHYEYQFRQYLRNPTVERLFVARGSHHCDGQ